MIKASNTPSQNTKVLAWYVQVVQKSVCTNVALAAFWRNSQKLPTVRVEAKHSIIWLLRVRMLDHHEP